MKNRPSGLKYQTKNECFNMIIAEITKKIIETREGRTLVNFHEMAKKYGYSDRMLRYKMEEVRKLFKFEKTRNGMYVSFNTSATMSEGQQKIYDILRICPMCQLGLSEIYEHFTGVYFQKEIKSFLTEMADAGIVRFVVCIRGQLPFISEKNYKNPIKYQDVNFHAVQIC